MYGIFLEGEGEWNSCGGMYALCMKDHDMNRWIEPRTGQEVNIQISCITSSQNGVPNQILTAIFYSMLVIQIKNKKSKMQ